MRTILSTLAVAATLILAAGCGSDDRGPAAPPPPSVETGTTGPADVPGAPDEGAPSYTALGSYWKKLSLEAREASAAEFIDANPAACAGVEPEVLARQTGVAFSLDFPLNVEVGDVMLETCALLLH